MIENPGYKLQPRETHQRKQRNQRTTEVQHKTIVKPTYIETNYEITTAIFLTWHKTFQEQMKGFIRRLNYKYHKLHIINDPLKYGFGQMHHDSQTKFN